MAGNLRREAWAYGRNLRDHLLSQYRQEYGVDVLPPPATIGDELLTDYERGAYFPDCFLIAKRCFGAKKEPL